MPAKRPQSPHPVSVGTSAPAVAVTPTVHTAIHAIAPPSCAIPILATPDPCGAQQQPPLATFKDLRRYLKNIGEMLCTTDNQYTSVCAQLTSTTLELTTCKQQLQALEREKEDWQELDASSKREKGEQLQSTIFSFMEQLKNYQTTTPDTGEQELASLRRQVRQLGGDLDAKNTELSKTNAVVSKLRGEVGNQGSVQQEGEEEGEEEESEEEEGEEESEV